MILKRGIIEEAVLFELADILTVISLNGSRNLAILSKTAH
jgi:hypothetical protein